jgi:ABC-type nitrate/sulfonate/bicarbonate transport system permease component
VVSLAIGIPLGLAIGWFRRVDYFFNGLLAGLNATPNVALIPLIILMAGIGFESKVIVVFLSAFFAVVVTTFTGVQSIGATPSRDHAELRGLAMARVPHRSRSRAPSRTSSAASGSAPAARWSAW